MMDRSKRPEIEPHTWTLSSDGRPAWPVSSKIKADLIVFDPPYFSKKADAYDEKSISGLPQNEYLEFLEAFFALVKRHAKKTTRLAFINADWRDFQNTRASEETGKGGILIDDYLEILKRTGWQHPHYPSPHVFPAFQCSRCFRHAEKKNTGRYRQICDRLKTK